MLFVWIRGGGEGRVASERRQGRDLQTQLSGRFRLVMTRILPAVRDIGMAQQTTRGVDRPLLLVLLLMATAGFLRGVCVCVQECKGESESAKQKAKAEERRGEERGGEASATDPKRREGPAADDWIRTSV